MTEQTFFSRIADLATCRGQYASDPINLTHSYEKEHSSARDNSMRTFMHQNSIAVFEEANKVSKELLHL